MRSSFLRAVALSAVGLLSAPCWAAAPFVQDVIASGLDNPRGISFDNHGHLYVAEAGKGGDTGKCIMGGEGEVCLGYTGALTRIDKTGTLPPRRVVRHIPSLANSEGGGAAGLVDVTFGPWGVAYGVIGLGADPAVRDTLGKAGDYLGHVVVFTPFGVAIPIADVARHEQRQNPAGGTIDSNPYGIEAQFLRQIVADAGGNSLIEVLPGGRTRTLAVFPPVPAPDPSGAIIPAQPVPTAVTQGPDGFLYVGQLVGFPFPAGGASVFRIPPEGGTPQVYATGFTNIVDIAFGLSGELYVLEISSRGLLVGPPGQLIRVDPNGTRTVLADGLMFPGGIAVDRDGTLYVTNFGTSAGLGEVLRIVQ